MNVARRWGGGVESWSSPLPYVLAVVKGNTHWNATALSVDDGNRTLCSGDLGLASSTWAGLKTSAYKRKGRMLEGKTFPRSQ